MIRLALKNFVFQLKSTLFTHGSFRDFVETSDEYKYEIILKNESHDFRTISDKEISNSPILEVVAVY